MSVQSFITVEKKSRDLAEKFAQARLMRRLEKIAFISGAADIKVDYSKYAQDEEKLATL